MLYKLNELTSNLITFFHLQYISKSIFPPFIDILSINYHTSLSSRFIVTKDCCEIIFFHSQRLQDAVDPHSTSPLDEFRQVNLKNLGITFYCQVILFLMKIVDSRNSRLLIMRTLLWQRFFCNGKLTMQKNSYSYRNIPKLQDEHFIIYPNLAMEN